jgi:H+/gluconate symporter-like permease
MNESYLYTPYAFGYLQSPTMDWLATAANFLSVFLAVYLLTLGSRASQFKRKMRPIIVAILVTCAMGVLLQVARSVDPQSYVGALRVNVAQIKGVCDAFVMLVLLLTWITGMVPAHPAELLNQTEAEIATKRASDDS